MRAGARHGWVWLLALSAACAGSARQYDPPPQPLSCAQATVAAYRAVRAMGYIPTAIELATPTRQGSVHAAAPSGPGSRTIHVRVTCTATTATLVAAEEGTWFGGVDVKRGFYLALPAVVAAVTAEPRVSALPPPQPGTGLQVRLEPVPGPGALLDFGFDVSAAALLPVRLTVSNATPRTYAIGAADVVLVRDDGRRVAPLSEMDVQQRVMAVTPAAASVPSPAEAAARLAAARFTDGAVPAGAVRSGWLFFPAGGYTRGRASVIDRETEEAEGVVVEFR